MSVMSDVSQSPMSSVKDAVPGPALQYGLAAQHWTPLALFVRQLDMAWLSSSLVVGLNTALTDATCTTRTVTINQADAIPPEATRRPHPSSAVYFWTCGDPHPRSTSGSTSGIARRQTSRRARALHECVEERSDAGYASQVGRRSSRPPFNTNASSSASGLLIRLKSHVRA